MKMIEDVTLKDAVVVLEPMRMEHLDELCEVGLEAEIWRWYTYAISTREDMKEMMESVLEQERKGEWFAFVTREVKSGRVAGSTSYLNIDLGNGKVEIGSTWLGPRFQRTAINTHAKYLMLEHGFERLGLNRVEFKTDALNERSRAAILRIGAKQEAVLRSHMVSQGGRLRDSVYYSVVRDEWPEVKARLKGMMEAREVGRG